jgi:hypothetical protein
MLYQLISRARRRLVWNVVAAEGARSAAVTAAVLILLLLLGTDILGWHWLIAMPAATLAAGLSIAIRRVPGFYLTAQLVDARLHLADTLSTALFYSSPEGARRSDPGMREHQHERALRASQSIRAADAVPFRTPRMLYAAAPLALVAGSLFILRYTWRDHLDLRQPIPAIAECLLRLPKVQLSDLLERKEPPAKRAAAEPKTGEDAAEGARAGDRSAQARPSDLSEKAEQQKDRGATSSASNGTQAAPDSNHRQGSADRREGQSQQDGANQEARQSDSSSSLISKVSDALRSMWSQLKPQSKSQAGGDMRQANLGRDPNGRGGRLDQRRDGRPGKDPSAGQPGSAQGAQGRGQQPSSAMGDGKNNGDREKQEASSAGNEEGDKAAKKAGELAAMGKISVILGKRSENVTGNAAVQTVSGEQTLITPYTDARATHIHGGAEIDRDEVPVALQDYVQKYFAEVRSRTPKGPFIPGK